MAPPKKSRKPRASTAKNQYSTELTSGQLVMGLTILMVFGLACFLLGVLIGKVDRTIPQNPVVASSSGTTTGTPPPAKQTTSQKTTNNSNETKSKIEEKTVNAKSSRKQTVKPSNSVPKTAPIESTDLPTTSPNTNQRQKPSAKQASTNKTPTTSNPASASPTSTKGWYVQVGAFKFPSNAEKEKKRIQHTYPHPIKIMKPSGSTMNKLLIGPYPEKSAADKVLQQLLKKHPGLFLHSEGMTPKS